MSDAAPESSGGAQSPLLDPSRQRDWVEKIVQGPQRRSQVSGDRGSQRGDGGSVRGDSPQRAARSEHGPSTAAGQWQINELCSVLARLS